MEVASPHTPQNNIAAVDWWDWGGGAKTFPPLQCFRHVVSCYNSMLNRGVWGDVVNDKAHYVWCGSGAKTLPSTVPVILIQGLLNQVFANQEFSFSLQRSVTSSEPPGGSSSTSTHSSNWKVKQIAETAWVDVKFPPFGNFSRWPPWPPTAY